MKYAKYSHYSSLSIADPHPPVFVNCPTDVGPVPGPTASWVPPTAKDNIGLQGGSPDSDFTPGQAFPVGQTLVTYTAEDLEGNEELCQFFVTVLPLREFVFSSLMWIVSSNKSVLLA